MQHKVEMIYNADSQIKHLTKAKRSVAEAASVGFRLPQTDSKAHSPNLYSFRCESSVFWPNSLSHVEIKTNLRAEFYGGLKAFFFPSDWTFHFFSSLILLIWLAKAQINGFARHNIETIAPCGGEGMTGAKRR